MNGEGISPLKARLAGLLYLGTIAAGIFAEVGTRSRVFVRGDGAATAANILQHAGLYRAGEAADIVMLCCYLAVTTLLYEMFARTHRQLALVAASFSITGIAVLAANGLLHLAPLVLLDSGGTMPIAQRDALIALALDLHGDAYGISLIFFGIYCVLIGMLVIRSGMLPHFIGGLMILGGAAHVVTKFAAILSPGFAALIPHLINMLPLLGEAALAIWLVLFGARRTPVG